MYNKILVPLDGSRLAESVFPHVEAIAKGCEVKQVILFRVCEAPSLLADYPDATMPATWEEHVTQSVKYSQEQCSLYLSGVEEKLKGLGIDVASETIMGLAAEKIADYAANNNVDLIIMASHGRSGPGRWAFGSVADKVMRSSCVPVMVIKAPGCVPGF